MKLNALLIDIRCSRPARLGIPRARLRDAPRPRRDRLHPGLHRRPARPRPAARRRRLDRQAVAPRGGDGAGRGGRASPPASRPRAELGPLVAGEIEIRADQFQAFVAGESLELTRREFELLAVLAEASGKVIEREEIYQRVWGYAMAHGDRSVDVFVRKLRSKLQRSRRAGSTSTPISGSATGSSRTRSRACPDGHRAGDRRDLAGWRAFSCRRRAAARRLTRRPFSAVHILFTPACPRHNKLAAKRCDCAQNAPEDARRVPGRSQRCSPPGLAQWSGAAPDRQIRPTQKETSSSDL